MYRDDRRILSTFNYLGHKGCHTTFMASKILRFAQNDMKGPSRPTSCAKLTEVAERGLTYERT